MLLGLYSRSSSLEIWIIGEYEPIEPDPVTKQKKIYISKRNLPIHHTQTDGSQRYIIKSIVVSIVLYIYEFCARIFFFTLVCFDAVWMVGYYSKNVLIRIVCFTLSHFSWSPFFFGSSWLFTVVHPFVCCCFLSQFFTCVRKHACASRESFTKYFRIFVSARERRKKTRYIFSIETIL